MSKIFFFHANGFPSNTYEEFFLHLNNSIIPNNNILGENIVSLKGNYDLLVNESLNYLSKEKKQVVGIGHSFGGIVCLLSQAKKPEIFKKIILLDPPIFNPLKRFIIFNFRLMGIEYLLTPAKKSMNRRFKCYRNQKILI